AAPRSASACLSTASQAYGWTTSWTSWRRSGSSYASRSPDRAMAETLEDFRQVSSADVYKRGVKAATLTRADAGVSFQYSAEYLDLHGPPVATTLPLSDLPLRTPAGAVPAFFAGLLPEGRRLSSLRRAVKTSADDELSLLLAV